MRNYPVLLTVDGAPTPCVFPDFTIGGQCTAATKKHARCGNYAWDQGQVAPYTVVFVGDEVLDVYGPLPAQAEHRYRTQRCRLHDSPDAPAWCDPEWEVFDPERHPGLTRPPTLHTLLAFRCEDAPPRIWALALRGEFGPAERRIIADILTSDIPD